MAARLPTPNGDNGTWGTILNTYLSTEHNSDGTHGLATGLVTDVVNTQTNISSTYTLPAPTTAGIHYLTLTGSTTLTFPTAVTAQSFNLILKQGGSGSYTISWPGSVKWASAVAPTLSVTVGKIDVLSFFSPDGTNWFGFVSGQDMR